jgi:Tfp pilus assembly protein PilV
LYYINKYMRGINWGQKQSTAGFTAVELLITLFVAVAFLVSGYTLYNTIIYSSGQARQQSMASNIAYNYLRQVAATVTAPCVAQTPYNNVTPEGATGPIANARITVAISCPPTSTPSLSRIQATITYGNGGRVVHALYATR